jgi:hypothetical protein
MAGEASMNKRVEITDEVIRRSAGEHADVVSWLRAGLKSQSDYLRSSRDRAFRWAYRWQMIVIILGLIASLAAIYSKPGMLRFIFDPDDWTRINIVVPLTISALTSALAFMDLRGVFARNSSAFNVIASIKSEIDYALLLGPDESGKVRITKDMIDAWDRKISSAMLEHSQGWERTMTGEKK